MDISLIKTVKGVSTVSLFFSLGVSGVLLIASVSVWGLDIQCDVDLNLDNKNNVGSSEQERCIATERDRVNNIIRTLVDEFDLKLSSEDAKQLRNSQRLWIQYRYAWCKLAASIIEGEDSAILNRCVLQMSIERYHNLESMFVNFKK